ncbi:hypothetical protein AAFP30_26920 [Gordonia sp. CPCC 205515]|uniref:hypothetical protein n=1 Tax=Gordonia sp. CPCC 205515 TaxID=3140791 RepID=UPI003AF34D81
MRTSTALVDKRLLRRQEALERSGMTAEAFDAEFTRLHGDLYLPRSTILTPEERIREAFENGPPGSVVGGTGAAVLHGTYWYERDFNVELVRGPEAGNRGVRGRRVRRTDLKPDDVTELNGIPLTVVTRTAFDLGRRGTEWQALGSLDSLNRATGFCPDTVAEYAAEFNGYRGVRQLRYLLPLIDPGAESLRESWVRLLIIKAGLPRPQTQIEVADDYGSVFARIDLGYEEHRVGIEYDGEPYHSTENQKARDAARDEHLKDLEWIMVHVDKHRLRTDPWGIIEETETALRRRGGYF